MKQIFLCFLLFFMIPSMVSQPKLITTVEGVKEYELPNGLRVLLIPDPSQTNIVVNIVYKVGSRHEGYGETGMAHLLEHMLFKQCEKFVDIKKAIADKGAFANGTTWYDRTNYFEVLSASDENLKWAIDMEADRMVTSKILEEELKKEFSVVRNEFEAGENYQSGVLQERIMSTMYLWHNYGKSTIGSKEDIERVNVTNLRAFYKKFYQPDNAVLVIGGKFDETKALEFVQSAFGPIPKPTRILQPTYTVEPAQDGERFVSLRRTGDIQYLGMAYHTPSYADKDFAANTAFINYLTNNPSGLLYKKLVDSELASKVSGYSQSLQDPGFSYFEVEIPKDKDIENIRKIVTTTMDNIDPAQIKEEDLIRAINASIKGIENTMNNTINFAVSLTEIIGAGDWRLWFLNRDRIENLRLDDVKAIATKYYKPSNRTLGLFVPDAAPDRTVVAETPDIQALLRGYKGKNTTAAKAEFENSVANIKKNAEYGTLPNGAKYVLLEKPTKGDKINATIELKWGNETSLMNKQIIGELTAAMLKNGTKNRSKKDIKDELDKIKTSIGFFGGAEGLNININTDKPNLSKALTLLDDLLKNPKFDSLEFEKQKLDAKADIDAYKSDPGSKVSEKISKLSSNYPKGHPSYAMGAEEKLDDISKTKLTDIKKYYEQFYGANNSVSSFVGELDKSEIKKYLNSNFGKWNSKLPYTEIKPVYFASKGATEVINIPDKTNANLEARINLNISEKHSDYPATYMANELLGGGAFLSSRIPQRLRENEGMSYGAGSFLSNSYKHEVGTWGIYAIYNPIYQARLDSALNEEIDKALASGFTKDELANAIKSTMQQNKTQLGLNGYIAFVLRSYLDNNRDLNDLTTFENKLQSLTLEQVNGAMKKYFDKTKMIKVYGGDFEKYKVKPETKKS